MLPVSAMRISTKSPWFFLVIWLIVNLLQAYLTELWHDEANYWMFSRHFDWGFFDHPPAAPLMIWLGTHLLPGELGVRIFVVLSSVATLYMLWKMTQVRDNLLFFSLIFSCLVLHIGGWIAAPDIPLLLFTSLFFLLWQSYLAKDSWITALLLALTVAAIAYSKYHGALPVMTAFLANLKLLRRWSYWLIPVLALSLLAPHLYWQYLHDFPTFRFHLLDRQPEIYRWSFIPDYLLGQLLVFGPFMSILLFAGAFSRKPQDAFEKTLRWSMIAVLGFFFLQSFRGRTEANWTATAFIPLACLAYRHIVLHPALARWVYRLVIPSLVVILVLRIYLVVDFLPKGTNPRNECHGYPEWAADIAHEAGDLPVVFYNNYQMACKYMFYTGKFAHVINNQAHPGNQFDLNVADEAAIQGQRVFSVFMPYDTTSGIKFIAGKKEIQQTMSYEIQDHFQSYNRLKIKTIGSVPEQVSAGDSLALTIRLYNPTDIVAGWALPGDRPVSLHVLFCIYDRVVLEKEVLAVLPVSSLAPGQSVDIPLRIAVPDEPGHYRFRPGLHITGRFTCRNANFGNIEVIRL